MPFRKEKINSLLKKVVSSFLRTSAPSGILITVTRVEISRGLRYAKIFLNIFPEEKEDYILKLLENKAGELRNYAKPRLKMKFLPQFEIEIDKGEKARQRMEEILAEHPNINMA